MEYQNYKDLTFDEITGEIVGCNFENCTFNAVGNFRQCNVKTSKITKPSTFDRCNLIACELCEGSTYDKTNIETEADLKEREEMEAKIRAEFEKEQQ